MKIGMLTDVYKPVINGVTNSVALCKREMERVGHEVYVFTFGDQDHKDDEANVIRAPSIPLSDTGYHLGLLYSRQARDKLQEMDILHAHHPFFSGRLATRYGRQFNLPIVFTNHTRYDLHARAYLPFVPPSLTALALEALMPPFTALCDLVVAPSEGLRRIAVEWGVVQEHVVVIANGIDLDHFHNPKRPLGRHELGIPDDAIVLVYCGRLGPEKNLPFLLSAFGGAAQAVPNLFLLIIGGGPDEGRVRERAAAMPGVRFAGPVAYDQIPRYLAVGDVFATASVTEVHPLSVIEALAAGLPVLGIRSPGISDTVTDGIDGYLTDHDLAAYTAMMVRLLLEPGRRRAMAAEARVRSRAYDIRLTAAALLSHYERLIADAKTRPPKAKLWETLAREVQQVLGE
jgi:1,2-diacylglycerol 3-alpha-glucosyltransferase